jgi:hypothetical protein
MGLSLTKTDIVPKVAGCFNVEMRAILFVLMINISGLCTVMLLLGTHSVRVAPLG